MISANVDQILKELQEYHKETVRRLEHMVTGFAYTISQEAIANTPIGDAKQFAKLYEYRQGRLGLQPKEGFARGSWQVNSSGEFSIQELYSVTSGNQALVLIKTNLENYKLGETLYIGNTGYYIKQLENNYSQQTEGLGIMQPTINSIMQTYQVDLVRLFNEN